MKKKILIVDDHAVHRGVVAAELMDLGFDVERARNAAEAEERLNAFTPDLLVTDLVIRGDRFEMIRWVEEVRKKKKYAKLPILFVTAYGEDMRIQVEGFERSDILQKPFDWDDILTKIRELLA